MGAAPELGVLGLAVRCLEEAFGPKLLAVLLFGSRARGDHGPYSDYDLLVVLDGYAVGPVADYFSAYRALRPFREATMRDTTLAVTSLADLREHISSALVLNALLEGIALHDPRGVLAKVRRKLLTELEALGIRREKEDWGYTWRVPPTVKTPFRIRVDIDDRPAYAYRLRLAEEHFEQARLALGAGAFVAAIHEAQLSIENAAKAVIAFFRPPSWVHDPSSELRELVEGGRIPPEAREGALELARLAEEAAPHHALSSYGDMREMMTPYDIYGEGDAMELVESAREALELARSIVSELGTA